MAGNANSGRRRKSRALRDLHNSVERPHHRDRPEPAYAVEVPDPPASLAPGARKEWDRISVELNAKRVIARVDLAVLASYCTTFDRLDQIRVAMGKKSLRVGSSKWLRLERSERQQTMTLRSLAIELGVTPASRARVSPLPPLGGEADQAPGGGSPLSDFDALEQKLTGRKVVGIDERRKGARKGV